MLSEQERLSVHGVGTSLEDGKARLVILSAHEREQDRLRYRSPLTTRSEVSRMGTIALTPLRRITFPALRQWAREVPAPPVALFILQWRVRSLSTLKVSPLCRRCLFAAPGRQLVTLAKTLQMEAVVLGTSMPASAGFDAASFLLPCRPQRARHSPEPHLDGAQVRLREKRIDHPLRLIKMRNLTKLLPVPSIAALQRFVK